MQRSHCLSTIAYCAEQLLPAASAVHCSAVTDRRRSADTGHCVHCQWRWLLQRSPVWSRDASHSTTAGGDERRGSYGRDWPWQVRAYHTSASLYDSFMALSSSVLFTRLFLIVASISYRFSIVLIFVIMSYFDLPRCLAFFLDCHDYTIKRLRLAHITNSQVENDKFRHKVERIYESR